MSKWKRRAESLGLAHDEVTEAFERAYDRAERLELDLARLRRLSVRIFDECGECGGTGEEDGGRYWEMGGLSDEFNPVAECESCDGTGRVLRDGAWVSPNPNAICFPASWMEAE